MTTVTVHQAKTNLSKLIAEVLAGGEVTIARGKEPVVKLVPAKSATKHSGLLGRYKGRVELTDAFFEPLPDDELALWNGEGD
jgi:prevent-host-death family protein